MTTVPNDSAHPVRITWKAGGNAMLVRLDGERVELLSARPWPPGSRPEANLLDVEPGRVLWFKMFGSHRESDGATYRVTGRLLDVTAALRDAIARALTGP